MPIKGTSSKVLQLSPVVNKNKFCQICQILLKSYIRHDTDVLTGTVALPPTSKLMRN